MAERDPRINPRPGDVTMNTAGAHYYVLDRCGDSIAYQEFIGEMSTISLADWQQFAATDQIVKRGEYAHG